MKKIVFLFILFFAVTHSLFAQDYIYKTNGQKLTVRVVNKNSSFVFYRLLGNRDNKTLQLPLDQVYMIDFEKSGIEYIGKSQNSNSNNNGSNSPNYNNNNNQSNNSNNNNNQSNNSNYNNTNNQYNQQQQNIPRDPLLYNSQYRSPGLAFLFSFLLSGGGQFYNKEYKKAGIMLGGAVAGWVVYIASVSSYTYDLDSYSYSAPTLAYIGLAGVLAMKVWSMVDAPVSAGKINIRNGFALNYKINNNAYLALTPSINPNSMMHNQFVYGATLSLNIH